MLCDYFHLVDSAMTILATDASIYEIIPAGVVFPRDTQDVVTTIKACHETGIPAIPRGAGTGLTGGAVGAGLQIDLSAHFNHISDLDATNALEGVTLVES